MNKKLLSLILTVVILFIGGYVGYASYVDQKNYQEVQDSINQLFQDKQHSILANRVQAAILKKNQAKIATLKDSDQKKKLTDELKKAVGLLKDEELAKKNTSLLLKNGILTNDVTKNQMDTAQNYVTVLSDKTLQSTLQKDIDEAKKQFTIQENAEKAVNALFSDHTYQKLAEKMDRNTYQNASQLVETIRNVAKKQSLKELLTKADGLLMIAEKEQAAATAKAKEIEAAKATQTPVTSAATATNSHSNGSSNSSSSSSLSSPPAQQPAGLAQYVANSKTAQHTDQIVTVVASGASGTITLWEKSNGVWGEILKTNGMVGSQGIGLASEESKHTPKGAFSLGFSFGKTNPGTKLPFRQITPSSYWISDVNSNLYNTWQEGNYAGNNNEHLADYSNLQYEYAIVINYNSNASKGAGSAFFLHVSNGRPTAGCVAVPRSTMIELMKRIHPGAYIIMVTSQAEITNY